MVVDSCHSLKTSTLPDVFLDNPLCLLLDGRLVACGWIIYTVAQWYRSIGGWYCVVMCNDMMSCMCLSMCCHCKLMQITDAAETMNPLLGAVESLPDGTVLMKGNMTLINLNLAGMRPLLPLWNDCRHFCLLRFCFVSLGSLTVLGFVCLHCSFLACTCMLLYCNMVRYLDCCPPSFSCLVGWVSNL